MQIEYVCEACGACNSIIVDETDTDVVCKCSNCNQDNVIVVETYK